ncbi:glyoxylate/hydroxypyruvate reductase GhrB [Budviciaceae bacterium BWR-B9]|uniref:Glyoxylate/hydroxypyruvate reductase GhrB n=1 Tax=Limnobaculum allomyrinae TaxID=2791986 RepID=A0ABS1IPG7_9GAMM|nr:MULTISPECIES: glyoxylate/hydroxypyruvate reductase GhrB [Limnobaculum]MBK5143660.1 glyoxylate/hydroxypyruvate reductase GhrB [Limnobaculum allomyrinae]MBV7692676.1 glyoxylate/hydroxypyruvate reductase GhrB [Limnobaculum sp. M2-1]
MKPSIVSYKKLPEDLQDKLEQRFSVTSFDSITNENRADFIKALSKAEGIIGANETIDRKLLEQAPVLRAVSTISAGFDNFDVDALTERKIPLMHTPGALTETVADTIMALVLTTGRRILNVAERVKAGEWKGSVGESWFGTDIHHKTMGIIGMGRIGTALAQRAHFGFGMKIVYNTRNRNPEAENRFDAIHMELDKLLSVADYVCLILPLNPQTRHLINAERFALMKPSAFFINAGRGPVVDEAALIEALQQGTIAGAGLDVFEKEPLPKDSPLLSMPNVVAIPHIGSATFEARYAMAASAVDNLIAAMTDSIDGNCVNPQVIR